MNQPLTKIVDQALAQLPEILEMDAPRAEAWASDLVSLAAEVCGSYEEASADLISRFGSMDGAEAAVAGRAMMVLMPDIAAGRGAPARSGPVGLPEWFEALGTSRCDGAWVFAARRGESAVFRFVDSVDAGHVVAIDLIPGQPESVGEVIVGPPDMVEAAIDPDSDVTVVEDDPAQLAGRVSRALGSTVTPSESLVVNGLLLAARIEGITGARPDLPDPSEMGDVPDLVDVDPDDDAWATDILRRALGLTGHEPADPLPEEHRVAAADAAAALRLAATADAAIARWLAASRGPVDLEEPDHVVVLAALAATVRPHAMLPLDGDAREAVVDLEWADWLGVVIGLVREGPGASAEPTHLIDLINRCPEVTSTIPKPDRPRIEWALSVCTGLWPDLGVTDGVALTDFGSWVLPRSLIEAWRPGT